MSTKSAIQLIIIIIIFIILGGVYFKYFSKEKITVDETPQQLKEKIITNSQSNNKNKNKTDSTSSTNQDKPKKEKRKWQSRS